MSGDIIQARVLRNKVNHTASKLRHDFYQTHIASLTAAGSHDWWKHMKTIMGLKTSGNSCMQGVANKIANGDYGILADKMNDFLISVRDKLPKLKKENTIFTVNDELPDQYVIPVMKTFEALCNVNTLPAKDGDLRLSASNACLPKTEISVFVTECVFFASTCYELHMFTLHDVLYS